MQEFSYSYNSKHLLLFHVDSRCTNAPQCYVIRLFSLPNHGQTDCEVDRNQSTADTGTSQWVKLSGHEINHLFPFKCCGTVRGDTFFLRLLRLLARLRNTFFFHRT